MLRVSTAPVVEKLREQLLLFAPVTVANGGDNTNSVPPLVSEEQSIFLLNVTVNEVASQAAVTFCNLGVRVSVMLGAPVVKLRV